MTRFLDDGRAVDAARNLVRCRGCGKAFRRGNEAKAHKPNCIKCPSCGHSVVQKIAGCSCCESA